MWHPINALVAGMLMTCLPTVVSGSDLLAAIADRDMSALRASLDEGCDPNVVDLFQGLPLQAAIRTGWQDAVDPLLEAGADPFADDGAGSALELAASMDDAATLRAMADHGIPLFESGKIGRTPLHSAAAAGALGAMQVLLDADGHAHAIANIRGETPLHSAAREGRGAAVGLLLASGADPNARDGYNQTAIHFAATQRALDVVRKLADAGTEINVTSSHNLTALDVAMSVDPASPIVQYLKSKGALTAQ